MVTKQDWILAADFRSIALIGLIALCIGLCACYKGLKVAKADVEKMCEKQQPQEEGQNQRKQYRGMRKGMFKWYRPKVAKTMIPLIVLALIAVHYEKKIWHEIDPMSDKWAWNADGDYWEAEEKDFEDKVDEVENEIDDWEDDVVDWVDETGDDIEDDAEDIVFGFDDSFLIEERTMDENESAISHEQDLKHHEKDDDEDEDEHEHEHEHEHDHKDKKEHDHHHHDEDKMKNF